MKNSMNKGVFAFGLAFIVLITAGLFIPIQLEAPPDARTIVDHNTRVYVTPPCFNQADMTNYLQETDYSEAKELGYEPESSCTVETLVEEDVPIVVALLKTIGVANTKWDDEFVWG
ncbi:hypothetical protein SAMN05192534_10187 [Alteribacillus persepolensis]|uniref:Uncharacterized protein n=1 Tax=Alteribacillus persepolensis TaxID=568899 RepID=A0A1G7YCZ9_9BACI|nr:hypothetical protein [Alteribacillus persepolensis]SDG94189.1 hypothetical protein SAMN05192534_10187 [Alteribacillus persepolensis]